MTTKPRRFCIYCGSELTGRSYGEWVDIKAGTICTVSTDTLHHVI